MRNNIIAMGFSLTQTPSLPNLTRSPMIPDLENPATRVIGIRIPAWATFTRHIFEGIIAHVRLHRERWQIRKMTESTGEMEPVKIDENWKGDGLIVFRPARHEVEAWKDRGIPVVNLSSESIATKVPTVIPDNKRIGQLAANHLLDLGLTRFAFWGDPTRLYSQERERAFKATLRKRGFDCLSLGFEISKTPMPRRWRALRRELLRQLADIPSPIGIFARDDIAGAAITDACATLGYRVPDDVAVIGCNNDAIFCHTSLPPLSSVAYPGRKIGETAAQLLSDAITGKKDLPLLTEIAPKKVVARESSDVLAFSDPIVAQSVHLIRREALDKALRVTDILTRLPISRANFQKRFKAALGHTPKEEINRVRASRVRELLETTDWSVKEIAYRMQFGTSEELSRFIRRKLHTNATEYRKQYRSSHLDMDS